MKSRFILSQSAQKENSMQTIKWNASIGGTGKTDIENMVAWEENTGYNDCGQEEREERKSKNKRDNEGKTKYDKSLYL